MQNDTVSVINKAREDLDIAIEDMSDSLDHPHIGPMLFGIKKSLDRLQDELTDGLKRERKRFKRER